MYFKWIQSDQLFVSSSGRLVMAGLTGAVYGSHPPPPSVTDADKSRDRDKDRKRKKTHKEVAASAKPLSVPSAVVSNLETTAPEVVAGAEASVESSVWAAAAVSCLFFIGDLLFLLFHLCLLRHS